MWSNFIKYARKCIISNEIENDYEEILPTESNTNAYIKDIEKPKNITTKHIFFYNDKPSSPQLIKIFPKMKLDELQNIAVKLNIVLKKDNNNKSNKSNIFISTIYGI